MATKYLIKQENADPRCAYLLEGAELGDRRQFWTGRLQGTLFTEKQAQRRVYDLNRYNEAMNRVIKYRIVKE